MNEHEEDTNNKTHKKYKKEIIMTVVVLALVVGLLYFGIKSYNASKNETRNPFSDASFGRKGDNMEGGGIFSYLFGSKKNRLVYVNMVNSTDANIELIEPITGTSLGKLEYPDKKHILIKTNEDTNHTISNNLMWCPKGQLLAINGVYPNNKVIIVKFDTNNKVKKIIELENKYCSYMAWKPDGTELALIEEITPNQYCIKIYSSDTGDIKISAPPKPNKIVSLSWSKNNEIAYGILHDVYILNINANKISKMNVEKVDIPKIDKINYISWCPDGIVLAIVYNSDTVILWNTEDLSVSRLQTSYPDKPDIQVNNIKSLYWRSNGKILAGIADYAVLIWIFDKDGKKDIIRNGIKETSKEDGIIHSFSWCPNKLLFAYNTKQKIMVCDFYTLECNKTYEYNNYKQSSISWTVY